MFIDFPLDCTKNSLENVTEIIKSNKEEIEKLLKIEKKTYLNFMRPLMELECRLNDYFTPVAHLNSVCDSPETREAFSICLEPLSIYSSELSQNKAIYEAVKEISSQQDLTDEQKKVIKDSLESFKLGGVHLEDDKKKRLIEINTRLSELSDTFNKNLLDATNAFEIILKDDTHIKDMPESDKIAAKVQQGYRFTLQAPSYIAFMTYCKDRELREEVYKAYMTRAENNSPVIEEMLKLKHEKANILGYKNYREMRNETMSCPSADDALAFLRNLSKKGKPYAEKELKELSNFAKTKGIDKVESYDTAYLSNLLKKEMLGFDSELFRPYFEKENVVQGLFLFLQKLFNINFQEVKDIKLWHETVKCFNLLDADNTPFARLYIDLEARPEKRGGAWMNNWHTARVDDKNNTHLPDAFIVANFPPSKEGQPSLLRHDDVHTLFHEAGHAIHHLFSKCKESDVSGINGVEWDAVEFPSQFLENFAYEEKVLKLFARHYETGEMIPYELIKKLIDNKNFQSGMFLVRQLEFGIFDLSIYDNAYTYEQVHNIILETRKETAVITPPDYVIFENGFGHIFGGGYSAGYYSYKWAEMLSADAYIAFSEKGVFDEKIAESFKENILEKGGSNTMQQLFINFMGRAPEEEKLLQLMGMK